MPAKSTRRASKRGSKQAQNHRIRCSLQFGARSRAMVVPNSAGLQQRCDSAGYGARQEHEKSFQERPETGSKSQNWVQFAVCSEVLCKARLKQRWVPKRRESAGYGARQEPQQSFRETLQTGSESPELGAVYSLKRGPAHSAYHGHKKPQKHGPGR